MARQKRVEGAKPLTAWLSPQAFETLDRYAAKHGLPTRTAVLEFLLVRVQRSLDQKETAPAPGDEVDDDEPAARLKKKEKPKTCPIDDSDDRGEEPGAKIPEVEDDEEEEEQIFPRRRGKGAPKRWTKWDQFCSKCWLEEPIKGRRQLVRQWRKGHTFTCDPDDGDCPHDHAMGLKPAGTKCWVDSCRMPQYHLEKYGPTCTNGHSPVGGREPKPPQTEDWLELESYCTACVFKGDESKQFRNQEGHIDCSTGRRRHHQGSPPALKLKTFCAACWTEGRRGQQFFREWAGLDGKGLTICEGDHEDTTPVVLLGTFCGALDCGQPQADIPGHGVTCPGGHKGHGPTDKPRPSPRHRWLHGEWADPEDSWGCSIIDGYEQSQKTTRLRESDFTPEADEDTFKDEAVLED